MSDSSWVAGVGWGADVGLLPGTGRSAASAIGRLRTFKSVRAACDMDAGARLLLPGANLRPQLRDQRLHLRQPHLLFIENRMENAAFHRRQHRWALTAPGQLALQVFQCIGSALRVQSARNLCKWCSPNPRRPCQTPAQCRRPGEADIEMALCNRPVLRTRPVGCAPRQPEPAHQQALPQGWRRLFQS